MLRSLWNRIGRRAATTTSRAPAERRCRLMLEPLEQRRLLSVTALFNTTIDDNQMELDIVGESRLFIYGDENAEKQRETKVSGNVYWILNGS